MLTRRRTFLILRLVTVDKKWVTCSAIGNVKYNLLSQVEYLSSRITNVKLTFSWNFQLGTLNRFFLAG